MTVGMAATGLANILLNVIRGTTPTPPAGVFAKLHVGDPGAAGTSNASGVTTRSAVTYGSAASGGSLAATAFPAWSNTGFTETLSHISYWDTVGPSGGTFLGSGALGTPQAWVNGNGFTLTAQSWSFTPIAS